MRTVVIIIAFTLGLLAACGENKYECSKRRKQMLSTCNAACEERGVSLTHDDWETCVASCVDKKYGEPIPTCD